MAFLVKPGKSAVMVMLLYALFGDNVCQGKLDEQFDGHFRSGTQKRTAIDADHTIEKVVERRAAYTEAEVTKWLEGIKENAARYRNEARTAKWNYDTDRTDPNLKIKKEKEKKLRGFLRKAAQGANRRYSEGFTSDIKRQLYLYRLEDASPKDSGKRKELREVKDKMKNKFDTTKACYPSPQSCGNWREILGKNPNDKAAWKAIHAHTTDFRGLYIDFVKLQNTGATDNGFEDRGDFLRQSSYGTSDIAQTVEDLYNEVKPMYEQLHAYMRRKIREEHPNLITQDGPIPDHLHECAKFKPYPDTANIDVGKLIKEKFKVTEIAKNSEEYFMSIGLDGMTDNFWEESIFEKPVGRNVSCEDLDSLNFRSQDNFRVLFCGKPDKETMHGLTNEMGHIEYHMAYRDQTDIYRAGANDAFEDAVGEVLYLPYTTQDLLQDIFKTELSQFSDESELNFLMDRACNTFYLIPFGYAVEKWRWGVYDNTTTTDKLNRVYWEMMLKYAGVIPPVDRTETTLDAATSKMVSKDGPFLRFVLSGILKYQFYEALCREAGHTGKLHKCNFYGSPAAGEKLKSMMKMGISKPWEDALEVLTDQREISAKPLLRYFEPLKEWLEKKNKEANEKVGWLRKGETAKTVIAKYF